jgi:hypothetical protein
MTSHHSLIRTAASIGARDAESRASPNESFYEIAGALPIDFAHEDRT